VKSQRAAVFNQLIGSFEQKIVDETLKAQTPKPQTPKAARKPSSSPRKIASEKPHLEKTGKSGVVVVIDDNQNPLAVEDDSSTKFASSEGISQNDSVTSLDESISRSSLDTKREDEYEEDSEDDSDDDSDDGSKFTVITTSVVDGKPGEDNGSSRPSEENLTESRSAVGMPVEGKPTEENSPEEKQTEEKPSEDKLTEENPSEAKPSEEKANRG